jgi:hypothetical protein
MDELNIGIPQPTETTVPQETTVTPVENTTQTETVTQEAPRTVKVKHLHEEKEIDPFTDEGKSYLQMGMDYSRVKSKYEESKPVIGFVEKLAQQNNMTVPEYLKAVEEYERQQEIETITQNNGLAPELAEELYLSRQERKERESQKQKEAEENNRKQEFLSFVQEFPTVNVEAIPADVWDMKFNLGISLTDAYIRHDYNNLKKQQQIQQANAENAQITTGSLTGNGSTNSSGDFISYDVFEKNKANRDWVVKNLTKISQSRAKW